MASQWLPNERVYEREGGAAIGSAGKHGLLHPRHVHVLIRVAAVTELSFIDGAGL